MFSSYPADPRPRRAVDAMLQQGMRVDLICLRSDNAPKHESSGGLEIFRLPITHRRAGKLTYAWTYSAFILVSAGILALRSLRRRYDLIHIHNMPDILVLSGVVPKALGAKVILDLHDPMPELMMTIFNAGQESRSVRLMRWLEKWSIARADRVITVNLACKRIFASRSCAADKIGVVMNSPDEAIFPLCAPRRRCTEGEARSKPFVIMYHGSVVERNGLDLAVKALARVKTEIPGAELRIFGRKTPFLEQVLADSQQMGLGNCVRYFGPRRLEDLAAEIDICDVGVIPNHRCAFSEINTPTRIFEYLSRGKPVVAPRTPGIQDYFSADSLLFFEPGNVVELAGQLAYTASHPRQALDTAQRGQQVYAAHAWSQEREKLLAMSVALLSGK